VRWRRAAAVRRWYTARGLPTMISVPYPCGRPADTGVDRFLASAGWTVRPGAATVMTAPATAIASIAPPDRVRVDIDAEPDQAWLVRYHYRGQPGLPPVARQVLRSAPWQAFGSIREDGLTLAIGRVAVARGWAGLTAIEVDPAHRRRGLARALTAALARQAAAPPLPPGRRRQRHRPRPVSPARLHRSPRLPLPRRPIRRAPMTGEEPAEARLSRAG
jgi:N-acetylglutamate synthase